MVRLIECMDSVVATVSGYRGDERFKLIKLISQTGASYVGAMSKSITHLVCWQLEGKKYDMAKSFGTFIVSHRWFEDCLKEGKRLLENPYIMKCGQHEGPISLHTPVFLDDKGKKDCVKKIVPYTSNSSNILVCNGKANDGIGCSRLPYLASLDEPVAKRRRLVKDAPINLHHDDLVDHRHGSCLDKSFGENGKISFHIADVCRSREKLSLPLQEISSNNFRVSSGQGNMQDIEVIDVSGRPTNYMACSNNSGSPCLFPSRGKSSHDHSSKFVEEDVNDNHNEGINESINDGNSVNCHLSSEVSCVICWTEFCSTRGVLSCGHRFCYTCIQGWADCMVSKGKVSTCPLCKASFTCITKVEGTASLDQKVYSQTIPSDFSDIHILTLLDNGNHSRGSLALDSVCFECHNREPEDLLLCCHICHNRLVHSCCLDPPLIPWTCFNCRDLRMLYQHFRSTR